MNKTIQNKSGTILVLVLWVLFFLSVVVLTLGFKNRISIRLRSLNNEQLKMFYLAKEGLNRAIMELAEDNPDFDAFMDNWSKDFTLQNEEGLLSYKVIDEDRRVNINTVEQDILNNIKLIVPGFTDQEKELIAKLRPFNVEREILAAAGIDEEVFCADEAVGGVGLSDLITVYSDGRINLNTASKEVLMILPQVTEAVAMSIIDHRAGAPFESEEALSEDLSLLGLTPAQVSSIVKFTKVSSSVFRIRATASSGNKHISKDLEMVISRNKGKFNTLFFKEN
ncbi:MAG: helix-hairpin-helix domain-containing protein [Candidatus Omnitrophota bacterium]